LKCLDSLEAKSPERHRTVSGPDSVDYANAALLPEGSLFCTIDKFDIYCFPTHLSLTDAPDHLKRIPRVRSCGRLVLRETPYERRSLYSIANQIKPMRIDDAYFPDYTGYAAVFLSAGLRAGKPLS